MPTVESIGLERELRGWRAAGSRLIIAMSRLNRMSAPDGR